jgi:hypothetical protein
VVQFNFIREAEKRSTRLPTAETDKAREGDRIKARRGSRFSVVRFLSILFVVHVVVILGGKRIAASQEAPGNITVFADEAAASCSITDQTPGPITVYVMHTNMSGMAVSDFKVAESIGFLATYISETIETIGHVGDFRNGITLAYGTCRDGPLLLGSISYQGHGTSTPCSYLEVVAWRYPWPYTTNCTEHDYQAPPLGRLYVNAQPGECPLWCSVATEQSTWGRVKALYRD